MTDDGRPASRLLAIGDPLDESLAIPAESSLVDDFNPHRDKRARLDVWKLSRRPLHEILAGGPLAAGSGIAAITRHPAEIGEPRSKGTFNRWLLESPHGRAITTSAAPPELPAEIS